MRKNLLSLALALVMCLGLTVPAFAATGTTVTLPLEESINITFDGYLRTEYVDAEVQDTFFAVYVVEDGSAVHVSSIESVGMDWYGYSLETGVFLVDSAPLSLDNNASTGTLTVNPAETDGDLFINIIYQAFVYGDSDDSYCWMCESDFARIAPEHKGAPGPNSEIIGTVGPDKPTQPTVPTVGGFTDVKTGDYFAEPVLWAVEKGITAGTSATTFSPNQNCTTAQILTFLWRANGSPKPSGSNPFTDVKSGDYYAEAAVWAYEKGMVSGSTFGGNVPCTRSMAVTYMWKAAGSPNAKAASFTDVSDGAAYASAVAWAVKQGVTAGTSATTFSPDSVCTRGQIVTFLYRGLAK